ncbi:MAG: type II toxin-antitoxin system CcdA family antitoxin [Solirubrobacteraceae bacterium]
MARVNVYLPDELAARAREAGVNVSGIAQEALEDALAAVSTDRWLDRLESLPRSPVSHERVIEVLDVARSELGARAGP